MRRKYTILIREKLTNPVFGRFIFFWYLERASWTLHNCSRWSFGISLILVGESIMFMNISNCFPLVAAQSIGLVKATGPVSVC